MADKASISLMIGLDSGQPHLFAPESAGSQIGPILTIGCGFYAVSER